VSLCPVREGVCPPQYQHTKGVYCFSHECQAANRTKALLQHPDCQSHTVWCACCVAEQQVQEAVKELQQKFGKNRVVVSVVAWMTIQLI
jgi:pyrroline-5-carboxylate reductase